MKKQFVLFVAAIFTFAMVSSAYAKGKPECPQPRKTRSAPASIAKQDKTKTADKAKGNELYNKTAKPQACKQCHGGKKDPGGAGAGVGKLSPLYKSPKAPRNFTCKSTMKKVSAGQMFWIIKNGSKNQPAMVAHKKLSDKDIWSIVKYIREDLMK